MKLALKIKRQAINAYAKFGTLPYICGIRSVNSLYLPDFLGIGPPKTGTTWLCENLRCHPDVYISKEKEVHYFNRDFHLSLRFYSDKFKAGANKIKGEITPEYYKLSLARIRFIHTIMPHVKLILLLRNPIEQAWSHAVMNLSLSANRELESIDELEFYKHYEASSIFARGGYVGIIENWWSVFPPEQLYIGLYEDIKNQPKKLLKEVFDHIGVSSDVDWSVFPYSNVIIPPVGYKYRNYDRTRGVKVNGYINTKHSMPAKHEDFLKEMYRHDIESLQIILKRDFSNWLCS